MHECSQYDEGEGDNKVTLRLHCGIGQGELHGFFVGALDRWEYLISGETLTLVPVSV